MTIRLPILRRERGDPGHEHLSATGGGTLSRFFGTTFLVLVASYLLTSVLLEPTKRNIEILAAALFVGIVLAAHPRRALVFTLVVIPFPAYTSVGSTSNLLIVALAALVLVKSRELKLTSPFGNRRLDVPLAGYFLMAVLSLYEVPTDHLGQALTRIFSLFSAIALYYIIVLLADNRQRFLQILQTVANVSVMLYVLALLQYLAPNRNILPAFFKFSREVASSEEVREGYVRVFATFPGYETFAEYIVLTLFLNYLLYRSASTLNGRLLRLGVLGLGMAALFATGTRAGLILLCIGWLGLFVYGRNSIPRASLLQLLFLGVTLFYLSLPFLGNYYSLMLERMGELSQGTGDSSVQARFKVLGSAMQEIANKPIFGHGFVQIPGRFRGWVGMNIHNLYATIAYEVGIPALLFFVTFLSGVFIGAQRSLQSKHIPQDMRMTLAFFLTLITMFVFDQLKIEFTRDPLTMHTTFTFLGLAVAATNLARREAGV